MEKNESTSTDSAPHGRSSDSIAPSRQGYYNTAGFADQPKAAEPDASEPASEPEASQPASEPEASQPASEPVANPSVADQSTGTGADPSHGPGPAGFGTTMGGNTGYSSETTPPPVGYHVPKRLYRTEGPVSGVSAGLAEYFNLDEILIRILIVAGSIVAFPVIPLVYIAAVFIIPKKEDVAAAPIMSAPAPAPVNTVQDSVDSFSGR